MPRSCTGSFIPISSFSSTPEENIPSPTRSENTRISGNWRRRRKDPSSLLLRLLENLPAWRVCRIRGGLRKGYYKAGGPPCNPALALLRTEKLEVSGGREESETALEMHHQTSWDLPCPMPK